MLKARMTLAATALVLLVFDSVAFWGSTLVGMAVFLFGFAWQAGIGGKR